MAVTSFFSSWKPDTEDDLGPVAGEPDVDNSLNFGVIRVDGRLTTSPRKKYSYYLNARHMK